ncbi:MAG: GTPase ObgE, partial [Nitrospirae bacterium]
MFIDQVKICVKAGKGGNGACSFRREKYVPFGGPDGGDGGKGGDVILVASQRLHTLLDLKYQRHYEAPSGRPGEGANRHGKNGEDVRVFVPVGTVVRDADSGALVADLVHEGQAVTVAHGGRGGRGNARFATSTNRAPRQWEAGSPG